LKTAQIWLVWPANQTVDVWHPASVSQPVATLKSGDMLDGLDVIPNFHCAVLDIYSL